jgi:hypothetical protein
MQWHIFMVKQTVLIVSLLWQFSTGLLPQMLHASHSNAGKLFGLKAQFPNKQCLEVRTGHQHILMFDLIYLVFFGSQRWLSH